MDTCSTADESADVTVMDSPRAERPAQETIQRNQDSSDQATFFQSSAVQFCEIPEVSLCSPDNVFPEAQATLIQTEQDLSDSSSLPRPLSSASSQLYHQVPQGCRSPQPRRCHCCGHGKPVRGAACAEPHPATGGPAHAECSAGMTGGGRSPSHVSSCRNAVRCHWLHGSHDGVGPHESKRHCMLAVSYSQVVMEYPLAVLVGCAAVLLGCSLAGLFIGPLPDFSDPLMGFEPRGTYIGVRQSALAKLRQNTGPGKTLSLLPQKQLKDETAGRDGVGGNAGGTKDRSSRLRPRRMLDRVSAQGAFLCDAPGERYAQLVFRSGNSASLWSLKAIYSMCEMEQARIRSQPPFQDLCKQHVRLEVDGGMITGRCCPSWSLGNYLALLSNASSCLSLTSSQVSESLSLLRYCAPYYHDGSLVAYCAERGKQGNCASVPNRCKHTRAVFEILHYLVDKDFLGPHTVEYQVPSLKYSLLFLPVEKGDHLMEIYMSSLEGRELTYKNTTITGMDLGIKQKLFKYYLARDAVYPVLAVVSLLVTMALYLRSLYLSALSLVAIVGSLLTSYFFYKVVFQLSFFPFLNLASALILFGSCSNQVFTFIDFWNLQLSQNPPASLPKRVNRVLQEVGYLILASGLTSSATFFSGYLSSIMAVRCFAVYLGTATLICTFSALAWLPSSLILRERYTVAASTSVTAQAWKPCCTKSPAGFWDTSSRKRCLFSLGQKLRELKRGLSDTSNLLFLKVLPCGVVKFRYIWVCWFAVLAAGGTYISVVDPGMRLPTLDNRATQLFRSSHPFERYDAEYRHQFMFERLVNGEDKLITLTLVWGVIPIDNGNHFDPKSNGSLVMDPDFNMSSPDAQVWLRDLCGRVQNQSFYLPSSSSSENEGATDNVCIVEQLIRWVSIRRCSESEDAFQFCCNDIPFPYPAGVFEQCLSMMVAEQHAEGYLSHVGGLYFEADDRIAALVMVFRTTYRYSYNFSHTTRFYNDILSWFNREISGAPQGLKKGWFASQLTLFDLQQCLSSETLVVTGFSVALTFALLLLTTWNIPLSIYGTAAVGGSVFVTVGLLVLLEWQLSGVEALFISAAAGLSVDFLTNYCIAYNSAPHTDRIGRVAHSLKRMGCPVAIGSGAFCCVGIIMLPTTALLFRKLGIFLFLVKCVACGFATFFFQSLCCFFGPQRNCGKIMSPRSSEQGADGLPSCSATDPRTSTSAANGAFGRSRVRRNFSKDEGNYLYPNQQRQRQRPGGKEPEQYELQPLACQLNDSFENSTCTSKLSNRPSVLSDDIQFVGLSPRRDLERSNTVADSKEVCGRHHKGCAPPPALQTSSPYRENPLAVAPLGDRAKEKLLCKTCRGQSAGVKHWNVSLSSTSSMEETVISQTIETIYLPSHSKDEAPNSPFECQPQKHLVSPQSSFEGLEDSNETCLSDIEPGPSNLQPSFEAEGNLEPQPGHLNGKRDTLRLSLREIMYETASPGCGRGLTSQSEGPVMLPNSKPDLPDVWIKRDGPREDAT
ncbi:protein dispatched homolog 2 [Esox lucius]|uniref:SSD domain-containing protein n=1 Tax=Esox lucius TaxID=8010 RepID=A0A3P9A911_ESOLU|nr:protein dispatched homolog 2 [Esox lucius]